MGEIARLVDDVRRSEFDLRLLEKVSYDPSTYSTNKCRASRQLLLDTLSRRLLQTACWRAGCSSVGRVAALLPNDGGIYRGPAHTPIVETSDR